MLVFSKDRSCQLRLFLQHCPFNIFNVTVLYKSSNKEYERGYEKLLDWIQVYDLPVKMEFESNFRENTLAWIKQVKSKCCCINTDDSIIFRKFNLDDNVLHDIFQEVDSQSFQLRLGLNTIKQKYYPPIEYYTDIIPTYLKDGIMGWNFRQHNYRTTNRGRPVSLDGGIHPTKFFRELLHNTNWNNPRELDGISTDGFGDTMISFTRSVLFCNSINLVFGHNSHADNYGHYYPLTIEELNKKWLDGKNPRAIFNPDDIISSHTEIPVEMI